MSNVPWFRAGAVLALGLVLVAVVPLRESRRTDQKIAPVTAATEQAPQPGVPATWIEIGSAPDSDAAKFEKALTAASIDTRATDARPGVRMLSVPARDAARARVLINEESVLQGLSFMPPGAERAAE